MDSFYFLPGDVLRVPSRGTTVLRGLRGCLWVTFEAAAADRPTFTDHFLRPGDWLELADGEVAVVSAADARRGQALLVWEPEHAPAPARPRLPWRRWLAPWRGWATARALAA
ncbi:MAG TPA: DUF2917 domain-containing protein [Ramlibacter sp.]|nr:DUF2917 domain-containing protein [Ramlibacter sp.]